MSEDEIANFKQRLLEMKYKLSHTLEGNAQEVKKPNEA
ncbi:prokaryotic dksA/traR C4-type zinc finger family protein, partial [Chlamydia psittaci 84-8471/1]